MRPGSSRAEGGSALVMVLGLLAVLSLLAAAFTASMRVEAKLAANELGNAEARAAADTGVHHAIAGLLQQQAGSPWQVDGTPQTLRRGASEIVVTVTAETGRIDLNAASDALLRGLLESVGLDRQQVDAVADAIIDWRDPDDLVRLNGAEQGDYAAAGRPGPANAPFVSVRELGQVLGIGRDLYDRLLPAVTVHSGLPGINPMAAPREALLALPGVDEDSVEAILRARLEGMDGGLGGGAPMPALPPLDAQFVVGEVGPAYGIRSRATTDRGAVFTRDAVVWIVPEGEVAYRILDWRDGAAEPLAEPDGGEADATAAAAAPRQPAP